MGTTTQTQPFYRFWVASIQTNKTINCGLINNAFSTATLPADEPHNIYVKFFDGEQLCKLDGTTIVSAANTSDAAAKAAWLAQGNLLIGRSSLNESFNFIGKIFAVKIYDANGVLVRDYIPVRKGTVGYLYDRVTGKLFGNDGTGDFVVGPDVVPVEYIESHGTEWIKIPMAASSACDISCDFMRTTFSQSAPFGGGDGNMSNEILVVPTSTATNTNWTYRSGGSQNLAAFSASHMSRHTIRWIHNAAVLDSVEYNNITGSSAFSATRDYMGLFCSLRNGDTAPIFIFIGRVYSSQFANATTTMPLLPIRVGSGTTWEGAMMDVLTRRIYRNAGTGAFTYGNDISIEEDLRLLTGEHDEGLYVSDEDEMNLIKEEYNGN